MFRRFASLVIAALIAGGAAVQAQEAATPLIYYGNAAGQLTMDRDRLGGNPLASGLIDALRKLPIVAVGVQFAVGCLDMEAQRRMAAR